MNTEVIIIIVVAVLVLLAVVAFFLLKKEKFSTNPKNSRQKNYLLEMIDKIKNNSSYWFYSDLDDETLSDYISKSPTILAYKGVNRSLLDVYFYMKEYNLSTSDIANTEQLYFLKQHFPKFTNNLP